VLIPKKCESTQSIQSCLSSLNMFSSLKLLSLVPILVSSSNTIILQLDPYVLYQHLSVFSVTMYFSLPFLCSFSVHPQDLSRLTSGSMTPFTTLSSPPGLGFCHPFLSHLCSHPILLLIISVFSLCKVSINHRLYLLSFKDIYTFYFVFCSKPTSEISFPESVEISFPLCK
jgi:hypothetical protein